MHKNLLQNAGNSIKRLYFLKFPGRGCPRIPLEVLAPKTRLGQIHVRPPPPKFLKPVRLCYMYYLKHEHECFIRYKTRGAAERFISDKALMLVF